MSARVSPDDIAAMREQGDLKEFLLMLAGRTPAKPAPEPIPEPELPRARPGAWPDGTSPPARAEPSDPAAWRQAAHEFSAWVAAGYPDGDFTCQCTACDRRFA